MENGKDPKSTAHLRRNPWIPLSPFFDGFDLLRVKQSYDAVDSVPDPVFGAPSLVGYDRPSICKSNDHASLLFSSC